MTGLTNNPYVIYLVGDHTMNVQGSYVEDPSGQTVENVVSIDIYLRISKGLTARIETMHYEPSGHRVTTVLNVPVVIEVSP